MESMRAVRYMIFVAIALIGHDAVAQSSPTQRPATNRDTPAVEQGAAVRTATAQPVPPRQAQPKPVAPPFQQTAAQKKRIDQLLDYWEKRSSKVKTYSCEFVRREYDNVFGPANPKWEKTKSEGVIRYSAPDKGEFRVEAVGHFQPPLEEGGEPVYEMKKDEQAEHWICNGQSVYELSAKKKQLIQRDLPVEMQGQQIADGPLPFMFGAKKEKLMYRYWIQELMPPKDRKGEYWLEAYPKHAENAAEFKKVRVILDEKTFLPNALEIFPPTHDGRKNTSRTSYVFANRKVNDPIHRGRQFFGSFISPKTPRGWKKVIENFGQSANPPVTATAPNAPNGQQPQRKLPSAPR
jgi:TIGR03009 family protein